MTPDAAIATTPVEQSRTRTQRLVVSALLAALLAAAAWITIPVGAVPVTLQVFIVLLAGLILPVRWAPVPIVVYLVLGAIGVPVFSGATGGLGILFGPTGGYLFGFLLAAPIVAAVRGALARQGNDLPADILGVLAGILAIYALGWLQLSAVTGMGLAAAFVLGVAPFIVLDLAKGGVAIAVARILRRAGLTSM